MTGTVRYCFGDNPASVLFMFERVLAFRRGGGGGFKTRVTTERVAGHRLHTLHVTAPVHASRKDRGL